MLTSKCRDHPVTTDINVSVPVHGRLVRTLIARTRPGVFPRVLNATSTSFCNRRAGRKSFMFKNTSKFRTRGHSGKRVVASDVATPYVYQKVVGCVPGLTSTGVIHA